METMEIIKLVGACAGGILSIIALFTAMIKPLRKRFVNYISKTSHYEEMNNKLNTLTELIEKQIEQNEKQREELEQQSEALKCSLRTSILATYYKYHTADAIPIFEKECFAKNCETYFAMNGNSFVHQCYETIMAKPTI